MVIKCQRATNIKVLLSVSKHYFTESIAITERNSIWGLQMRKMGVQTAR